MPQQHRHRFRALTCGIRAVRGFSKISHALGGFEQTALVLAACVFARQRRPLPRPPSTLGLIRIVSLLLLLVRNSFRQAHSAKLDARSLGSMTAFVMMHATTKLVGGTWTIVPLQFH